MRNRAKEHFIAVLFMAALLLPPSCNGYSHPAAPGIPEEEVQRVRIILSRPSTKAGGIDYGRDEEPVGRWAYFLFEHFSGSLACRGEVEEGEAAVRTLRTGEYDIEVIANYPVTGAGAVNVSAIGTRAAFDALKVTLDRNAPGAFVMAGTTEDGNGNRIPFRVAPSPDGDVQEAGVHLRRLVSKVTVSGITRRFTNASLAAKPLTLKGIYLTNVYTEARYGLDYAAPELGTSRSLWYNALGWHKEGSAPVSAGVDALVGERNLQLPLAQGETAAPEVNLYFLPNPVLPSADVPSSGWTGRARCTRLVVWVQVEGRDYYYPATLPKEDAYAPIGRNSLFSVRCTLTGLGSAEEDDWIPGAMEVSFEPVLKNDGSWDAVSPVSEES